MLSGLRSLLWGGGQREGASPRPDLHQLFPADEPRADDQRRWFEGAVLTYSPEGGTVTGDVWFGAETVRGRPPVVGDRVYGEARRRDSSRAWLALHVEVCDDEWDDGRGPAEARVVGRVACFDGEVLVLTDRETEYRLHQAGVEVDFTPQEGDWLELESESEIPLEVTADSPVQVRPLRRWELDGEVTFVSHEPPVFGIVDNQVYFYAAAWTLPQLPRRGDRVRCNAVESSQTASRGVTLNWRAVRVAALEARAWLQQPAPLVAAAPSAASEQLLQDKRGVSVSGGDFGHLKCGECRRAALVVRNSGPEAVVLRSARLMSDSARQFSVVVEEEREVAAGVETSVPVECHARLLGAGRSLCVLQFGDFQLGRWLSVHVQDPDMHRLKVTAPGRRQRSTALVSELDARQGCVVVPGQPAFKPAPFVSARLPPYPLPPRLLSMDGDQLLLTYPCLADPLRADNYRQRLDLLLYIEEVEMVRSIRRFDMTGVALTRAGEYLQLAVPGLAESRPSIVVGDKVLLSHPFEEDGFKYEGHVHEVRHSALRLLFHPDFQQRYTGQEYNAQFEFSRSQMRQLHRAVETALARLGPALLFPDRAPARLPQVAFIEEFCQPSDPVVCSHKKRVSFDLSERRPVPAAETTALPNGTADPPSCPGEGVGGAGTADSGGASTVAEVADQAVFEATESEVTPTNSPRHLDMREEGCLGSEAELAQSETTPTNSPEHHLSAAPDTPAVSAMKHQATAPRNGLLKRDVDDVVAALTRQSSEASDTAPPAPLERPGPQQSEPADLEDSLSVTSGSDASFASVDCPLDESHYTSASCASLTETPQGKRRTRRRRRLAVVDRLFHSPAQRPAGEAGGGDADGNGHGVQPSTASGDIVVNGRGTEQTAGNTSVHSENGQRLSCDTTNSQKAAAPLSPPVDSNAAVRRSNGAVSRSERVPPTAPTAGPPDSPACPAARPPCPRPLASPLKAPPLSRAACHLRRRALCAVGSAGGRAPFLVPRFTAVPPAEGVTPPRDAAFVVPRLAAETGTTGRPGLRLLRWFNPRLNDRQRCAVRRVLKGLARPLPYIIYGPPGSGKTVTVVECILQTYTLLPNSRVLVATPSNSAADLITERLHLSGALHKAALVRLTSFNRSEDSCPDLVQPYVMSGDSLEAASRRRVIVGTAAAVGNLYRLGLRQGHFTHVFLDEAGHMTEPEALVPLGLVSALDGQAVLAGDPQQLGPVLQSRYAAVWGLQTSMLERLSERPLYGRDEQRFTDHGCYNPLLVTKLVNNYRSHRELITVPSRLFYHSELVPCAAPDMANKWCHLDWLPKPGFPMLFHGVRGENVQEGDSPSWFNPTEAFQVIRYLQKLGSAGVDWDEVGVISPYRKQTEKIRELIHTFALPTVKVGSVEEFQGQEREVIILTTVRSSEVTLSHDLVYRLGFMQNRRRFNVAVTRAKCLLIVVGNPLLLAADQHWRHLVVHAVTNGAAVGCDGVL